MASPSLRCLAHRLCSIPTCKTYFKSCRITAYLATICVCAPMPEPVLARGCKRFFRMEPGRACGESGSFSRYAAVLTGSFSRSTDLACGASCAKPQAAERLYPQLPSRMPRSAGPTTPSLFRSAAHGLAPEQPGLPHAPSRMPRSAGPTTPSPLRSAGLVTTGGM